MSTLRSVQALLKEIKLSAAPLKTLTKVYWLHAEKVRRQNVKMQKRQAGD